MNISLACAAASLFTAFLPAPPAAFAQADHARERRLADEVIPGIVAGDTVWRRAIPACSMASGPAPQRYAGSRGIGSDAGCGRRSFFAGPRA
jgi:hypothetical protein